MFHKIPEFISSRKGRDLILIALIFLTGTAGFGLGRLSVAHEGKTEARIIPPNELQTGKNSATHSSQKGTDALASVKAAEFSTEAVVASKNSDVYHLPWCSGANRIKEENKVWFDTPEAAREVGLRPAANCKGLQ